MPRLASANSQIGAIFGRMRAGFRRSRWLLRVLVVCWAKDRFPPADDGTFYHVVAQRIAHGQGYTWLWPDGAVTYAAHYPVGYPALLGLAYALFGSQPVVAMVVNAVLGALSVFAAQRAVIRYGSRRQALLAALLLALHPGLVFYTPALMTEGVTAELLVVATWLLLARRLEPRALAALGARRVFLGGAVAWCALKSWSWRRFSDFLRSIAGASLPRAPRSRAARDRAGGRRVPALDPAKLRPHGSLRVRQRQRWLEPADRFGRRRRMVPGSRSKAARVPARVPQRVR